MALFEPDVRRIGRPEGEPFEDRVGESLAGGTPEPLRTSLRDLLGPDKVLTRLSDLVRYASDASPYRYIPRAVVVAEHVEDIRRILRFAREAGLPVVFRSAGTSLNGQAQTDGILVDVRRHWSGLTLEDDGVTARLRPGMVLDHANRILARRGRRLGPDPASASAATIGGIIANNAGGMRSGTRHDSYQTVESMVLVLPSGTVVDTAAPGAEAAFAAHEPALASGLLALREELMADQALVDRVRRKFGIRNTMGYRLCALLDAETPLEIFRRLVVGSEGTLAFVAEGRMRTLPVPEATTVSWLHFASIADAVRYVPDLVALGAAAVELMVAPALAAAAALMPGASADWADLPPDSAALLVEFGAPPEQLDRAERLAVELLADAGLLRPVAFTRDEEAIELAWTVREGMFGLMGKLRPEGTALITEDVCCAPDRVAEFAEDINAKLVEHGFRGGVAGHAAFGNLHFSLTPLLGEEGERARYDRFMHDLVDLVVNKYDGSLKAEHGTGLNMAPFVENEWGAKATGMMWRIKELADPQRILGPGVLLNRDPRVHLDRLKSTPAIEATATTCVECGFCEPVCPSRNVTVTPRQRIVLRREMARQPANSKVLDVLLDEYEYDAIQTCAADGSCGPACPVGIDTGTLIKHFRRLERTPRSERVALAIAKRWARVERLARGGLSMADAVRNAVGDAPLTAGAAAARRVVTRDLVPAWPGGMPQPAPSRLPATSPDGAVAVYFPSCVNRIFGRPARARDGMTVPEAMVALSARAGAPVVIPSDVTGHCCGMPWSSKGYQRGHAHMARRIGDALWAWTGGGRLPVVVDANSCTHALVTDVVAHVEGEPGYDDGRDDGCRDDERKRRHAEVRIVDSVTWLAETLLPGLQVARRLDAVAIHPTCSGRHLGLDKTLTGVVAQLAVEAVVPDGASCCGTAGDRGLLHPELVRSALRDETQALDRRAFDAYVSANRTCEMGLHQATGHAYESVVLLAERLTRPGPH